MEHKVECPQDLLNYLESQFKDFSVVYHAEFSSEFQKKLYDSGWYISIPAEAIVVAIPSKPYGMILFSREHDAEWIQADFGAHKAVIRLLMEELGIDSGVKAIAPNPERTWPDVDRSPFHAFGIPAGHNNPGDRPITMSIPEFQVTADPEQMAEFSKALSDRARDAAAKIGNSPRFYGPPCGVSDRNDDELDRYIKAALEEERGAIAKQQESEFNDILGQFKAAIGAELYDMLDASCVRVKEDDPPFIKILYKGASFGVMLDSYEFPYQKGMQIEMWRVGSDHRSTKELRYRLLLFLEGIVRRDSKGKAIADD